MTAIASYLFRHINSTSFFDSFDGSPSNALYMFIAKTDPWSETLTDTADGTAYIPVNGNAEFRKIYDNMIAMKRVNFTDMIRVVPRYNWTSNTSYVAWDDDDSTIFSQSFYVITSALSVYKCLKAGSGVSTVEPSHTGYTPQTLADGYMWHYMFSVPSANVEKFLNASFIPVETATSGAAYTYQESCITNISGRIYSAVVVEGGSGYTSATATITGDGTGATATVSVSGGEVTGITITNPGTSAYNTAEITISGDGTGATARLVFSPSIAHGSDPELELGAYILEVAVDLEYADGSGDFIVDNDFRQLGLLMNPYTNGTTEIATGATLSGERTLTVDTISGGAFAPDDIIVDNTTGAKAYIDAISNSSPYVIKFHQNYKTKFVAFGVGNEIQNGNGTGAVTANISAIGDPEYEPYSGKLLYIENRSPTERTDSQIEKIRLIIVF